MKKFFIILFILIHLMFNLKCEDDIKDIEIISQVETFKLSAEELKECTKKGLAGDSDSISRVWEYYAFSIFDYENERTWLEFLAESDGLYCIAARWNLYCSLSAKVNSNYLSTTEIISMMKKLLTTGLG